MEVVTGSQSKIYFSISTMHNIASKPCHSCPYRCDVPSGIWDVTEYDKLPEYDKETFEQPQKMFLCHQQNGCLCRGWLDCHGSHLLSIRIASVMGLVDDNQLEQAFNEGPKVAVFSSGAEAAKHGKRGIKQLSVAALGMIQKLVSKRKRTKR